MAYENTEVSVYKSQADINALVSLHGGSGIGFESEPPHESFTAKIKLNGTPYIIRVGAKTKEIKAGHYQTPGGRWRSRNGAQAEEANNAERRRVWRVLFWHLKAVFEAADAGVIELRQAMLAYVVMPDGTTISEKILPRLDAIVTGQSRLLMPTQEAS